MEPLPTRPEPDDAIVDLAGLVGLVGIVIGLLFLAPGDLGFDRAAAIGALLDWIPVTVPLGIVVAATVALDLGAGITIARLIRGHAFDRLGEALLQGFVVATILDLTLLGLLAGLGWFSQPVLLGIHGAILVGGIVRGRPVLVWRLQWRIPAVTPFGGLVVVAWTAPVLLQLASPVVPFLDVLPNHVAPAEHLRTFGALGQLSDTQSPIYGPSRILLGYTALLGTITTMSGLPAGEVLAGFILPSTLLVAVAIHRLAGALGGDGTARWALLAFATTTSVARLGDARATVIVLPLVAWALARVGELLGEHPTPAAGSTTHLESQLDMASSAGAGRPFLPDGVTVGLGLGVAMLVHPVIGLLAWLTVAIVVVGIGERAASLGVTALATAGVMALPQAATMAGLGLPPIALVAALTLALTVGLVIARQPGLAAAMVDLGRATAVAAALFGLLISGPLVRAAVAGAEPLITVMELSIVAGAIGVVLGTRPSRSIVLWAAVAAGFGVAMLTQLVPEEGSGLLGQALRFELPKTLQYWVPVFVAILAAGGLSALATSPQLPAIGRAAGVGALVAAFALPIRTMPIDAFHLGEHRLSETLSIALRWVGTGFWVGFPDSRYVVDAPRQAILDAVRAEIRAGRLGPDTPVLHIAGSFQQWVATPLGVFDGVTETDVTPDAVESIHTVGGRLRPIEELAALLASGPPGTRTYGYVLFEPDPEALPPGIRDEILAAGYEPVFANAQGELFAARTGLK